MSAVIVILILIAVYIYLYANREILGSGQHREVEFVIYYSYDCPFCLKALQLLKDKKATYSAVEITDLPSTLRSLGNLLPSSHNTKPIIFRRGKFLGGYTQLVEYYKRKSV